MLPKGKETEVQQQPVIVLFCLEKIVQAQYDKYGYDTHYQKLQPDIIGVDKICNTKDWIQENNGPNDIIGLVPRFF